MKIFYSILILILIGCNNAPAPPSPIENTTPKVVAPPVGTLDSILHRFDADIHAFLQKDSSSMPAPGQILFIGSSSIRMWETLVEDMAPLKVINRGFGGSTLPEVIRYTDKIVYPYKPSTIVLYCGENDISEGASPEVVFQSFKTWLTMIKVQLPETKVIFLPMKPSIARWNLWPQYQKGNQLIQNFIATQDNVQYLDITPTMLFENGQIDTTIFIEDGLHMNAKGYVGWTNIVKPVLEKMKE